MAVERMKDCDNISVLAQELGVHRRSLYFWQKKAAEGRKRDTGERSAEGGLIREIQQLKQVLAEKTLEVDFFKGALQKVRARRQRNGTSGEKPSTPASGK